MNKKLLIALAAAALFVGSNCAENAEGTVETEVTETTETTETAVETPEGNTAEEGASGGSENIVVTENAEIDLGEIGEGTGEEGTGEEIEEVPTEGGSGSGTIDGSGTGSGTVTINEALSGQVIVTSGAALVALAALLA